jgi:hypothetical protein
VRNTFRTIALTTIALALTTPVQASLVGITTQSALGANDAIDFSQLGTTLTVVNSPENLVSANNQNVVMSSNGGSFLVFNSDDSSNNFAANTLVITNFGSGNGIKFSFANPITGFGINISADIFGSFVGTAQAFDKNGNLLGSFSENGTSSGAGDGSAIFLGLNGGPFYSIIFSTSQPNGLSNDFGIANPLLLDTNVTAAVPEAPTWTMMLLGFVGLAGFGAHRRWSDELVRNQVPRLKELSSQ